MQKEILLITNYFPPEKGAAANRMHSIAENLGKAGYTVKVICPLPNYPNGEIFEGYRGKLSISEKTPFGEVSRLWTWPSNSTNKFIRLLSMLSFSLSLAVFFLFKKTPKKIFIQYSPVFVGFTAVCLGKIFSKKIILNISDLWPLAGLEMGILNKGFYYTLLLKIERYCYKKSDLIIGQSEEILLHISKLENKKPLFLYRNIPNFKMPKISDRTTSKEVKIVYAGLLGVAQGIFEICEKITFPQNVSFHIYGAGPDAERLKSLQSKNVYFYGEVDRAVLHIELEKYDIAFVPLTNRIYGSVPSKIFEYTRLGLPILYFAGGEGGKIVAKESLGWVIPVNNTKKLQEFINTISENELNMYPKEKIQNTTVSVFNFEKQFKAFISAIETV
ncbi:glycosyltransferase family 4 protein [Aequorivita sp. 609]|uniref:glycosyltransferase family 4 protein n=1 Tax=Aequorivita TaxID=153265 RepID=UPI00161A88CD|nr:glycosyltransferase family 4 protein [Aequorivita sinensis]MBB6682002.1 glycosyltransferase family 4 protein [Aequorivita sp. 609]